MPKSLWPFRWRRFLRKGGGYLYACAPELDTPSAIVLRAGDGHWYFDVERVRSVHHYQTARAARTAAEAYLRSLIAITTPSA